MGAEYLTGGVKRSGDHSRQQLNGAHGFDDRNIDHAIVHAAVGEQVDVVLNDRGIARHAADAVELLDNAVVLNGKVRHRGVGRGESGEEVAISPMSFLVGAAFIMISRRSPSRR